MTCVRRTAVVTRVERTSPYLSAREADEALDCFPRSSPHRFRARVAQVRRTAALAPPSVAIDECWPRDHTTRHLTLAIRPAIHQLRALWCVDKRDGLVRQSHTHSAYHTPLTNAPQWPAANFLLANASLVRADRHTNLRAVYSPIGWSDSQSFE